MGVRGDRSDRSELPVRLTRWALRSPRAIALLWLLLLLIAGVGASQLRIETSTDSVLDQAGEPWAFYQESLDRFGGDELIVVALDAAVPLEIRVLEEVRRMTGALESIDGVRRVDSLATAPFIRDDGEGGVDLSGAIEHALPRASDERERLLRGLMADRIAPNALISRGGKVIALNVLLEGQLARPFDDVIADVRTAVASRAVRISGVPIFRTEINLRTASEIAKFGLLTLLIIAALFRLLFGSTSAVIVPLLNGAVGTGMLLGAMGAAGIPLSLLTMVLPSIVLALGCAYSVHYVFAVGREEVDASTEMESVALPVVLSGLTTSIGFLGVALVPIQAMRDLGGLGAFAALATTAAVVTISPPLLAWLAPRIDGGVGRRHFAGPLRVRLVDWLERPRTIVVCGVLIGAVGAIGLTSLHLETDATKWFRPGSPVREAYDGIRRDLSGISPINVVIEPASGATVTTPEMIAALDAFGDHLRTLPDVGKVLSIADPVLQMHEVFAEPGRAVDSAALIEQYLLLLGSNETTWDLIDRDYSAANVVLRAQDNGSEHLIALAREAEGWWAQHGVPGSTARSTGIMYEFARSEDEIARGQVRGVLLAVACVALLLLVIFRSLYLAFATLLANAVPIAVAFGAMGWLGFPLDAGTVLVANLALGIAVDDAIHFASVHVEEQRKAADWRTSLERSFDRVLPALVTTTIAVGTGFAVLGFSEFAFTRNLGVLTAIIMALCLIADVVLLPALLRLRHTAR